MTTTHAEVDLPFHLMFRRSARTRTARVAMAPGAFVIDDDCTSLGRRARGSNRPAARSRPESAAHH